MTIPDTIQGIVDSAWFRGVLFLFIGALFNDVIKPAIYSIFSNFLPSVKKRYLLSQKSEFLAVAAYKNSTRDKTLEAVDDVVSLFVDFIFTLLFVTLLSFFIAYLATNENEHTLREKLILVPTGGLSFISFTSYLRSRLYINRKSKIYANFEDYKKRFEELGITPDETNEDEPS